MAVKFSFLTQYIFEDEGVYVIKKGGDEEVIVVVVTASAVVVVAVSLVQ